MRTYGSLNDVRMREVGGIGAVGFIVSSNGSVELAFLRSKKSQHLEVGMTGAKFVSARHVEETLL
jgi:hypothetical protein